MELTFQEVLMHHSKRLQITWKLHKFKIRNGYHSFSKKALKLTLLKLFNLIDINRFSERKKIKTTNKTFGLHS